MESWYADVSSRLQGVGQRGPQNGSGSLSNPPSNGSTKEGLDPFEGTSANSPRGDLIWVNMNVNPVD